MNKNSPFILQKVSNHGTSNPIVARLSYQAVDLVKWLGVENNVREDTFGVMLALQQRLLQCFDIFERMKSAKKTTLIETEESIADGAKTLPYVVGLNEETELFLVSAKSYVRELVNLLNVIFKADLEVNSAVFWDPNGQNQGKVVQWALSEYGEKHPFTKMLLQEDQWIAELIKKRNASEHPGGKSGTLVIENFRQHKDGFIDPSWRREGKSEFPESSLYADIETIMHNMLTIAEEVFIHGLTMFNRFPFVVFLEIPEKDRDPEAPIRYRPQFIFR